MKTRLAERVAISHARFSSFLLLLLTLPVLFFFSIEKPAEQTWQWFYRGCSIAAVLSIILSLVLQKKHAITSSAMAAIAGTLTVLSAIPLLKLSPSGTLLTLIALTYFLFYCIDLPRKYLPFPKHTQHTKAYHCSLSSAITLSLLPLISSLCYFPKDQSLALVFAGGLVISTYFFITWIQQKKAFMLLLIPAIQLILMVCILCFRAYSHIPSLLVASSISNLLVLVQWKKSSNFFEFWRITLIEHPARALFSTFMLLSILGTILLLLPIATHGEINLIDALFTSVSAVCVTGLIVLDTPHAFTLPGQLFILLLIQLGGLGIMAIATVTLNAFGKRLSLKHESTVSSLADTSHRDLIESLRLVLKYTVLVEVIGAALLSIAFISHGDSVLDGLWRGIFTSISAFCNAGFALQSDSLMSYQDNPIIIHTIGFLIILGGLAPSTCLAFPKWVAGKHTPVASKIAIITTLVLLVLGTIAFLAFEWEGMMAEMSIVDKISNAWFQSVTLRTAGFNSLDLSLAAGPTFLIMLIMMFIGGSPGGTAGGIKTTTVGVLALTFFRNITNHDQVIFQHRRISHTTIYRAITLFTAGLIILIVTSIALEITQQIPSRDLIYEATSAIATVGLSIGATSQLDSIGKIIIILAMFTGRIGPLTLFMLLGGPRNAHLAEYPEAKISLS